MQPGIALLRGMANQTFKAGTPELANILSSMVEATKSSQLARELGSERENCECLMMICSGLLQGFIPESDTGMVASSGLLWASPHAQLTRTAALSSIRLIRNIMANGAVPAELLSKSQLLPDILQLIDFLLVVLPGGDSDSGVDAFVTEQSLSLLRCCLQVCGNACTSNTIAQEVVWQHAFPSTFTKVFGPHTDRAASCYGAFLLYNCLRESEPRLNEMIKHVAEQPENVLRLLLLSTLITAPATQSTHADFLQFASLVVLQFCSHQSALVLFESLGDVDSGAVLSRSQIVFIRLASHGLEDGAQIKHKGGVTDDRHVRQELLISWTEAFKSVMAQPESEVDTERALRWESLRTLVGCFGVLSGLSNSDQDMYYQHVFSEQGILECVLDMLLAPTKPDLPVEQQWAYFGLESDLMRVLSNLCYRNRANQDMTRERGGIQVALSHCKVDDTNPFLREWALFAVRNLCDNNLDNQAIVGSLKYEGVAENEALKEMGIEAEIDPATAKLRLKKAKDAE